MKTAQRMRVIADTLDTYDELVRTMTEKVLGSEMQNDLRRWAAELENGHAIYNRNEA